MLVLRLPFLVELEFGNVGFLKRRDGTGRDGTEFPEKNLSEQRGQPTTNSAHFWRRRRNLIPGHLG